MPWHTVHGKCGFIDRRHVCAYSIREARRRTLTFAGIKIDGCGHINRNFRHARIKNNRHARACRDTVISPYTGMYGMREDATPCAGYNATRRMPLRANSRACADIHWHTSAYGLAYAAFQGWAAFLSGGLATLESIGERGIILSYRKFSGALFVGLEFLDILESERDIRALSARTMIVLYVKK
jgi:hypothetical protein